MQHIRRIRIKLVLVTTIAMLFSMPIHARDVNESWGKASSWYSGSNLVVSYLDGEPYGRGDGHCAYVKTKRAGSSYVITHKQNCSASKWIEARRWKGNGHGYFKLCRSGHWNCVPSRASVFYLGAGE